MKCDEKYNNEISIENEITIIVNFPSETLALFSRYHWLFFTLGKSFQFEWFKELFKCNEKGIFLVKIKNYLLVSVFMLYYSLFSTINSLPLEQHSMLNSVSMTKAPFSSCCRYKNPNYRTSRKFLLKFEACLNVLNIDTLISTKRPQHTVKKAETTFLD